MSVPENSNNKFPIPEEFENKRILSRDGSTVSIWQEGVFEASSKKGSFNSNTVYDVLIVGGGITGLTAALLLQKAGKMCLLAEAKTLGHGTTSGTTAHINTYVDTSYYQIKKDFGKEGAELVAEATKEAIDLVYRNVKEYNIDCGFEFLPGLLYAETEKQGSELEEIYRASEEAGVSVRIGSEIPIPVSFKKTICYESQAQFHPIKYILGLASEFQKLGGIISENTFVRSLDSSDSIHTAHTDLFPIQATNVIYATHIPPGINLLHFRCAPYRSYAVGVKVPDHLYPEAVVYDMQNPYHYFRSHNISGQKYLIVGGEDHKTGHGDPDESFKRLEQYVKDIYKSATIEYRWSAQYYEPVDGLPYIGKLPGVAEGIYVGTGYSGNGITYGTIAAKILSDLIVGEKSRFQKIFSPSRIKPVAGFQEFVKENSDVAYKFIADRFGAEEIGSLSEIEPDTGAVIEYNKEKLAIYKDIAGKLHALNPVCTHAKCIVNWNNSEKSWDCPCHGARYDTAGNVLNGPASKNLQKVVLNWNA